MNIRLNNQIALFSNNDFLQKKTSDPCIICFDIITDVVITQCRHIFCLTCANVMSDNLKKNFNCPECRTPVICNTINITTVAIINGEQKISQAEQDLLDKESNPDAHAQPLDWRLACVNRYGSKMCVLIEYLNTVINENSINRIILFSQYNKMLKLIGKTLDEYNIKFVYCQGNNSVINKNIAKFKNNADIRIIMLSNETSNSGSNLTEANHIIFIDVLHNTKEYVKAIETQAIGRAVRLGQKLPVKIVRFITKDTVENTYFNANRYDINTLQN